jgi:3-mercaptopyruvate sulfurtransferase SseA
VALILRRRGIERVRPLTGGLDGWRERGFPVESRASKETAGTPRNSTDSGVAVGDS